MPARRSDLLRRVCAEAVGTAFLLAAIVGSGIMADRLAGGNVAVALLANTLSTAAALAVLILTLAPISGAHFNPLITLIDAFDGGLARRDVAAYVLAQVGGAFAGTGAAHAMFGLPLFTISQQIRAGGGQVLSEVVATFGLVTVVWACARHRPSSAPFAVAAYIGSAYWFAASTSFANPAVTLARAATDTFTGIRSLDVPGFLLGQVLGAGAAFALCRWLFPARSDVTGPAILHRQDDGQREAS